MKNRIVSLALIAAMLLFPCLAFALEPSAPFSLSPTEWDNAQEIHDDYAWRVGTSTVYVPVKRYVRVGNGWSEPQSYYPAVGHVDYPYWCEKDEESDTWQGGFAINDAYPRPYVISSAEADLLNPVFSKISHPVGNFHSSSVDQDFGISISGGSFSVTYNSSLYYNADGTLDHVERTTMLRSFNWSYTGP